MGNSCLQGSNKNEYTQENKDSTPLFSSPPKYDGPLVKCATAAESRKLRREHIARIVNDDTYGVSHDKVDRLVLELEVPNAELSKLINAHRLGDVVDWGAVLTRLVAFLMEPNVSAIEKCQQFLLDHKCSAARVEECIAQSTPRYGSINYNQLLMLLRANVN